MKNKRDGFQDIKNKSKNEKKKEEYSRLLKELYLDYLRRGMKPTMALKKAKFVVESFGGLNKK